MSPEQQFVKVMNDELVEIMGAEQAPLARRTDGKPTVVLLAGLQGTGKTTAAAKLAKCVRARVIRVPATSACVSWIARVFVCDRGCSCVCVCLWLVQRACL